MARDGAGQGAEDRPSAADLHRRAHAGLRADRPARLRHLRRRTVAARYVAPHRAARSRRAALLHPVRIAPHVAAAALSALVACPAGLLGWAAALTTGRVPTPLARLLAATHRHYAQLNGTVYLLTDDPPPRRRRRRRHSVDLRVPDGGTPRGRPEARRRLRAVPGMVLLDVALGALVLPSALLAWPVIVVTGRMPAWLHRTIALGTSYHARSGAYASLLTPVRPRLRERDPRTGRPTAPGSGGW